MSEMSDMSDTTGDVEPAGRSARRDIEDKLPRGIWVRVLVYVFAGHALAAFIYMLFTLGGGQ
ncbi:DUF6126 family protein [Streptomyces longispororuber]|uniref:DUF6126 family protein n=1 Tax=Streptomyces longispororuber TaxID=68230 RepID=UPI00210DCB91|nr:DUF6126 family protein [Streptomyces longispororuber]MCQ4206373.1 DUF6126 family protein [Streptomyces longispororuber]